MRWGLEDRREIYKYTIIIQIVNAMMNTHTLTNNYKNVEDEWLPKSVINKAFQRKKSPLPKYWGQIIIGRKNSVCRLRLMTKACHVLVMRNKRRWWLGQKAGVVRGRGWPQIDGVNMHYVGPYVSFAKIFMFTSGTLS